MFGCDSWLRRLSSVQTFYSRVIPFLKSFIPRGIIWHAVIGHINNSFWWLTVKKFFLKNHQLLSNHFLFVAENVQSDNVFLSFQNKGIFSVLLNHYTEHTTNQINFVFYPNWPTNDKKQILFFNTQQHNILFSRRHHSAEQKSFFFYPDYKFVY